MNKVQREKLSKLETQLWQTMNGLRAILDDYPIPLDNAPHDYEYEKTLDEIKELKSAVYCLTEAVEYILNAESIADVDSMPNQGGEK